MILKHNCFKKINQKSIVVSKNFKNLLTNAIWSNNFGFKNFVIPQSLWILEPFLKKIHSFFPIEHCIVLNIPPFNMYNWHNDTERGLSINMKLCNNIGSHTLFGEPIDEYSNSIIELEYEKDTFYLFNTQQTHCVINFDNDRYMFSVIFQQKKELTYETVYSWCEENGLLDD